MPVGTDQGTVYRGRQGTGFATVLGDSKALPLAMEYEASKKAAKQKERADAMARMQELKPEEVWHYYSAEANNRWQDWINEGAEMMTDQGIDNPWTSSSPDAIQWQLKGSELKAATDNINQAKALWDDAMKDIGTRGDKYTPEYLVAVKDFAAKHSFDNLASGQFDFPQTQFIEPTDIYQKFLIKDAEDLRKTLDDGQVPTDGILKDRVEVFFQSPDNAPEAKAAQQMYASLPVAARAKYKAMAERMGWDDQPWKGLAFDNYKNRFIGKPRSLIDDVLEYANKTPKDYSKWVKEDLSGVTVGGAAETAADDKYFESAARSHFTEHSYLLDDEGYMEQLGVDFNLPRVDRKNLAAAAMTKMIRDNTPFKRESSLRRDGSGIGDKELVISYDKWRERIGSNDQIAANEAANWLFGIKGEAGMGDVTNAHVLFESQVPFRDMVTNGKVPNHRVVVVEYSSLDEANKFKEKFYKEEMLGVPDGDKEPFINLLNMYEGASEGARILYPVTPETEQVLKQLHDRTARAKKSLYIPTYETSGALNQTGSTSKPVNNSTGVLNNF